jgi:hypothetical protein
MSGKTHDFIGGFMDYFKKFVAVVVAALVLLVLIGFILPSKWKVERSIVIGAPTTVIYSFVANMKTGWAQWSEFDYEDKTIQYTYSGAEEGAGAERSWTSKSMGNGHQKITKADPSYGVDFDLSMDNGFSMKGQIHFEAMPNAFTKVTWIDEGDVGGNPFSRYMGLMMNKMMGGTFERSLATLKQKAESTPPPQPSPTPTPEPSPIPKSKGKKK